MSTTDVRSERHSFAVSDDRTLSDQVYDYLAGLLEQGKLRYGDTLNIKQIAAQLDMSPMPIRDAIKRLEQEHVIVVSPRSGCQVRTPRKQDTLDAIDARWMIERFAVGSVYSTVRLGQLRVLDDILEVMRLIAEEDQAPGGTDRLDEYIELDRRFHYELCALARNDYINRFYRTVNMHLSMSTSYGVGACHGVSATYREHVAMVHHLKAHSPEVLAVLESHLQRSRQNILTQSSFISLPD